MNSYEVAIPITGYLSLEVKANSAEEAKEIAFDKASLLDLVTWAIHEEIVEGNIFHGDLNKYEIEKLED